MNGIYRLMNILATDGNHPESHLNKCLAYIIKGAITQYKDNAVKRSQRAVAKRVEVVAA